MRKKQREGCLFSCCLERHPHGEGCAILWGQQSSVGKSLRQHREKEPMKNIAMGRILQEMELKEAAVSCGAAIPQVCFTCAVGAARAGLGRAACRTRPFPHCDVSSSLPQRIALKRGVK